MLLFWIVFNNLFNLFELFDEFMDSDFKFFKRLCCWIDSWLDDTVNNLSFIILNFLFDVESITRFIEFEFGGEFKFLNLFECIMLAIVLSIDWFLWCAEVDVDVCDDAIDEFNWALVLLYWLYRAGLNRVDLIESVMLPS